MLRNFYYTMLRILCLERESAPMSSTSGLAQLPKFWTPPPPGILYPLAVENNLYNLRVNPKDTKCMRFSLKPELNESGTNKVLSERIIRSSNVNNL